MKILQKRLFFFTFANEKILNYRINNKTKELYEETYDI